MDLWEIILLAIVAIAALLFVGGYIGNARIAAARDRRLRERIAEADHALAAARATDRGWDRPLLDAAARTALETRRPGVLVERMELVQVVDHPGVDADSAVYQVATSGGDEQIELVRRDGGWVAVDRRAPA